MTLVVLGPITKDLVIIGDKKISKIGGATFFQSFVFEKFFEDYLFIINCFDEYLMNEFPSVDKVKLIKKDNTHYFINYYPDEHNLDFRCQISNFAKIPIYKEDLENILPDSIDGFVLNPLNRYDFPIETIDYLKNFEVPIFLSIQGFLRVPDIKVNENYTIKLSNFDHLHDILSGVTTIFLDEVEKNFINDSHDIHEMVITNGSYGSRIITNNHEIKIPPVKCDEVIDATGCGDTYMAAYISQRLKNNSIFQSGNFASKIASDKLKRHGHY